MCPSPGPSPLLDRQGEVQELSPSVNAAAEGPTAGQEQAGGRDRVRCCEAKEVKAIFFLQDLLHQVRQDLLPVKQI